MNVDLSFPLRRQCARNVEALGIGLDAYRSPSPPSYGVVEEVTIVAADVEDLFSGQVRRIYEVGDW